MGKAMMTRTEIHSEFVRCFGSADRKAAVFPEALRAVEEKMKVGFPASYRSFITTYGSLATPDIITLMVAAHESGGPDIEGFDVARFFSPTEIVEAHSSYAGAGMDSSLVPIAIDAAGNLFGFRREERRSPPDDAPVYFFDHDFCELRPEADSFDAWLAHYLPLKT